MLAISCAAEDGRQEDGPPGWVAGLGYFVAPDPFVGDVERQDQVFPLVGYIGERLTWLGPSLSYRLIDRDDFSLSVELDLRFEGFDSDSESAALDGLIDRDSALEAGLEMTYGPFSLVAKTDVSSTHGGTAASLGFGDDWSLTDQLGFSVQADILFRDGDLSDYYFGVSPGEARSFRPAFEVDETLGYQLSADLAWRISDRALAFVGANYEVLDDDISSSPIVNQSRQLSWQAGFIVEVFR
ncbi:MAG: MipA/OmpV family protein [Pseudomonadota bacterium]